MSTISASTTSTTGFKVTSDTTGTLVLQTGASPTTAITIDASQNTISTTTYQVSTNTTPSTSSGNAIFYKSSSGAVFSGYQVVIETGSAGSRTTAATFDNSGNLGVGATSPAAKLDVAAGSSSTFAKFSSSNADPYFRIQNTSAGGKDWIIYSSGTGSSLPGTFRLFNNTDNLTAFTVDSSGAFMVGTSTSWLGTAPFRQGGIQFGNANYAALYGQTGGTNRFGILYDAANTYLTVTSGGTFYVYNTTNGVYLSANATSWTSNSDERLKDIIEPITDAASKVSSLRAVIGKYKSDADGTRRSFLIAQDVQAVLPEAVSESQSKDQEETYLGLQYTEVIPLLVAAIKEQQAIIETLTNRITALEAK